MTDYGAESEQQETGEWELGREKEMGRKLKDREKQEEEKVKKRKDKV